MLNRIIYADGTVYGQPKDSTDMQRPGGLSFGATVFSFDYDGAGNVKTWDGELYRYDSRSRLAEMTLGSLDLQKYAYDDFGSLTSVTTNSVARNIPTSTTTNWLTGASATYDTAGNLTKSPAGIPLDYDGLSNARRRRRSFRSQRRAWPRASRRELASTTDFTCDAAESSDRTGTDGHEEPRPRRVAPD